MAENYEKSVYNQLMDVMARLDKVEHDLSEEKIEHRDDVDRLNRKINDLEAENNLLADDNERLKSIINNDSSNTSLPPSTDQKTGKKDKPDKPANTFNGREKTSKKTGAQKGHKGSTLTKEAIEAKIKDGTCRHKIKKIGNSSSGSYVTKYVVDLDIQPIVTEIRIYADKKGHFSIPPEYRSDVTYGSELKSLIVALYSEGVMSNDRIADFLNAASKNGLSISAGTVYECCKKFSKLSEPSIGHLEAELLNSGQVATDATTVTVDGKQNYIRNFSIDTTVTYHAMKSKSISALKKLDFLGHFTGILLHDHETALYHFGTDHAECNVHLVRYLRKNTEDTKHTWSDQMIALLCRVNEERNALKARGELHFSESEIGAYEKEYDDLIARGRSENKTTTHKYAKKGETTLLNRLVKYKHNHLLFLHNFAVLFDDNISERDLRKAKNRQKMAGGFRKDSGHEMYCKILTMVETLKRRNMGIIQNIKLIFEGTPAIF